MKAWFNMKPKVGSPNTVVLTRADGGVAIFPIDEVRGIESFAPEQGKPVTGIYTKRGGYTEVTDDPRDVARRCGWRLP